MSFVQNLLQLVFRQTGFNLRVFSALFLLLVGSGLKRSMHRKIGQFFTGFFHISKKKKTALQLNRTEILMPGKKKMLTLSYLRTGVRK